MNARIRPSSFAWLRVCHFRRAVPAVNIAVDNNPLSAGAFRVSSWQFIESTETGRMRTKFGSGGLEDNPRQLGNGWVRLAGSTSPKPRRKARGRRQDSPVLPAAFARCRQREKRNRAARNDEKPFQAESSNTGWFRARVNRSHSRECMVATVCQHGAERSGGR
jgi:hypothetical protein